MAGDTVKVKTTLEVDHVDITDQAKKEVREQLFNERRVNLPKSATTESWYKSYVFDSMRMTNSELMKKWESTFDRVFRDAQYYVNAGVKDLFKSIEVEDLPGKTLAQYIRDETIRGWWEAVNAVPKSSTGAKEPIDIFGHPHPKDTRLVDTLLESINDIKEGIHEINEWSSDADIENAKRILDICEANAEEFKQAGSKAIKDMAEKLEYAQKKAEIQRETNRLKELEKRETQALKHQDDMALASFKADEWIRAKKEYYDYRVDKRTEGTLGRFFEDFKQMLRDTIVHDINVNKDKKDLIPFKTDPVYTAKDMLKHLKDGFKDLFSTTSTKKLGMNILATLGKTAISILMNVLKTAFNLFKSLFKGVVKALLLPAKKLIGLFKSLIKSALQHSQMYYAIQRILDSPLIILLEYLLIPLLKVIIPAVTRMIKFVVDNKDAILKWGEVLASFVGNTILQPMLENLNESFLNNPFAGIFNMMSDIFKAMISWVHDNKDKIGEIVEETINAAGEMLVGSATLAGVIIEVLGTALLEAINGGLLDRLITPLTDAVYMVFDIIKKILEQPQIHEMIMSVMVMFIDLFMQSLGAFIGGAFGAAGKGISDWAHDTFGFNSPAQLATIPWMINPFTALPTAVGNMTYNTISNITNNSYESKSEMRDITSAGATSR